MPTGIYERKHRPLLHRFAEKFEIADDGCWNWTAFKLPDGYGKIGAGGRNGKHLLAHRAAYELAVGPIPNGLQLDHLCRNPGCVNPDHLELVTNRENCMRGLRGRLRPRRTYCSHGHEFTPENTALRTDGTLRCRACSREWARARYYRIRSQ